jgi:hypothetical protein
LSARSAGSSAKQPLFKAVSCGVSVLTTLDNTGQQTRTKPPAEYMADAGVRQTTPRTKGEANERDCVHCRLPRRSARRFCTWLCSAKTVRVEPAASCGLADHAIFVVQPVEDRRRDDVTSGGEVRLPANAAHLNDCPPRTTSQLYPAVVRQRRKLSRVSVVVLDRLVMILLKVHHRPAHLCNALRS